MNNFVVNTSNYSKSNLSKLNTVLPLNSNLKCISISGCNQIIKKSNYSNLYIEIPKKIIDNFINYLNPLVPNINYTLDKILDIFGEMTFYYDYNFIDSDITFMGKTYKGYYLFHIKNISDTKNNNKHRYYAFCMIRHFYYYQEVLLNYLKFYPYLKTDLEKILVLSLLGKTAGYTFVGSSIPKDINLTFKTLLNIYYIYNNNNNIISITPNITLRNKNWYKSFQEVIKFIKLPLKTQHLYLNKDNNSIVYDDYLYTLKKLEDPLKNIISIKDSSDHFIINNNCIVLPNISFFVNILRFRYQPTLIKPFSTNIVMHSSVKKFLSFIYLTNTYYDKVINIDSFDKNLNSDIKVINSKKSILFCRNRSNITKLFPDLEINTKAIHLKKKSINTNNKNIILDKNDSISKFLLRKYVILPYYNDIIEHYLLFTKSGLVAYYKCIPLYINNNIYKTDIELIGNSQYTNIDKEIINQSLKVFSNSDLDVGFVKCISDSKNPIDFYVDSIKVYMSINLDSKNKFIDSLNNILCVD